jgi:hypothetical protein
LSFRTPHSEIATVLLNDLPRTCEPNPGPTDPPLDIARPVEALEDVREISRRDTDPVVLDRQHSIGSSVDLLARHRHQHRTTGRAVLDRIREQIVQDTPQADPIPLTDELRQRGLDAELVARAEAQLSRHNLADQLDAIYRRTMELQWLPQLQPGYIQQIIQLLAHLRRRGIDTYQPLQ